MRKYDALLGRFMQVDPLWENYPAWTPYQYGTNNPTSNIDPSGEDVIILNDRDAAYGQGHNGLIVGNDEDGWVYYSKDGEVDGKSLYSRGEFASLNAFLQSGYGDRYDHGARISTTPGQDRMAQSFAERDVTTPYDAVSSNCADLVDQTLNAIGKPVHGSEMFGVAIPNLQFDLAVLRGVAREVLHFDHSPHEHPSPRPLVPSGLNARSARHIQVDMSPIRRSAVGAASGITR